MLVNSPTVRERVLASSVDCELILAVQDGRSFIEELFAGC